MRINPDKLLRVLERLFKRLEEASDLSRNVELTDKLQDVLSVLELLIFTLANSREHLRNLSSCRIQDISPEDT